MSMNVNSQRLDNLNSQLSVNNEKMEASKKAETTFFEQQKNAGDEIKLAEQKVKDYDTQLSSEKTEVSDDSKETPKTSPKANSQLEEIKRQREEAQKALEQLQQKQSTAQKGVETEQKTQTQLSAEETKIKEDIKTETKAIEEAKKTEEAKQAEEAKKAEEAKQAETPKLSEKEQKENEQLKQMCNGNEELAKKLEGLYDPKAGESLAQTAHELHQNGTFNNYCALGVRQSLEAEGILEKDEIRGHASDLIEKYGASGKFDVVKVTPEETKDLPPGTILAIKKEEGNNDGSIGQYGHIAIIGYKHDENGNILKDKDGNPIREEISDHVGGMRDRTGKECYVIIPKSGDAIGTQKSEEAKTGTGQYLNDGAKSSVEDSNLDSATKSKLLGKIAGHQELSQEDIDILKNAGVSLDTTSAPTETKGTGRFIDSKLKAGIERSNLDDATKARLLAMPEDSELSEADAKLISGTNLSSVTTGSGKMKAFSVANTTFENETNAKLKNAKTEAQRQQILANDGNVKYQHLSEEHLDYFRSFANPRDAEFSVTAYVDNFPNLFGDSPNANYMQGYEHLQKLQGVDRKDASGNKDRTITLDELRNESLYHTTDLKNANYLKTERAQLIKFLEENDKTAIDVDKLRQLMIEAYEAGDGRHVNFMDCLL